MNTSHTPGPWKIDTMWGLIKHGSEEICALHSDNPANARLIASAPKLLEALKDLVSRFPEGPYEGAFSANARRVIASVEGGKS